MAAHALLETARDALFLARLPPSRLAWVYLAIAVVSLGLFVLQERSGARSGRTALATWLVGSAAVDVLLWALIAQPATWTLYLLYTWSGVFASLVVVRFWTLLGDLFSIGQAKRVFALIGAGGGAGAIGGSLLARALTDYVDARHLLLSSTVVLIATALATRFLLPRRKSTPTAERRLETVDLRWPLQAVWMRPYLRRVAGIVLLSAVTLTLVDFLFKSAVATAVPADQLGSFFATTYVVLNALSLAAQFFVVSWVIRRLSVNRVLSVLPALVVSATVGVVLGGGLLAALALKGCDGVLRHSLHRTALEVLYVPLTGDLRARVKGFIDVLGQRGGQAAASVFILLATAFTDSLTLFGVAVILLGLSWIRVASTLEAHYLDLFREALSGVAMRTRLDFPDMDLASLETLLTHLNSADDSEVIAALDMFAEQERSHLIPALVLYHPSDAVVLRALELFTVSGRQDFLAILGRLLEHDAPAVRAAALRAHAWAFGPRQELYVRFADDPSPIVCATARVGTGLLWRRGARAAGPCGNRHVPPNQGPTTNVWLWRALFGTAPAPCMATCFNGWRTRTKWIRVSPSFRRCGKILSARFISRACADAPDSGPAQRGARHPGRYRHRIADPTGCHPRRPRRPTPDVRLHVPRTIGFFPPRAAAEVLLRHLESADEGTITYPHPPCDPAGARAADPQLPAPTGLCLAVGSSGSWPRRFACSTARLTLETDPAQLGPAPPVQTCRSATC